MMKTKRSFRRAGCWRSDKDTIKAQTQASNKVFKKETKVASEYTEEKKASPNNAKRSRPDAENSIIPPTVSHRFGFQDKVELQ